MSNFAVAIVTDYTGFAVAMHYYSSVTTATPDIAAEYIDITSLGLVKTSSTSPLASNQGRICLNQPRSHGN